MNRVVKTHLKTIATLMAVALYIYLCVLSEGILLTYSFIIVCLFGVYGLIYGAYED